MKRNTLIRRPRTALTAQPVPLISHRRAGNEMRRWFADLGFRFEWYLRSRSTSLWIYFASFRSGAVKIGCSHDPIGRIRELGAGRHGAAQPLVLVADGCLTDERLVLRSVRRVAELIDGNEVFAFSPKVATLVSSLRLAAESSFFDNPAAPYAKIVRQCG